MHSRKTVILSALAILSLLLASCGGAAATPTPVPATTAPAAAPTTAPAAAPTEAPAAATTGGFALILPGPWEDHSWNEAAYNALQALGKKGERISCSENVQPADAARVMRDYVDQGYEFIFADSFGYQDAVFEVAQETPNVNFAWGGGINQTAKNVADLASPFYEAAYAAGIIAGYMSESGVLAGLYGFDIPTCHSMGEAMLAGAKTVNPDAQLITTAVGDWEDVAKAKEAALAQADAGADFWCECGEGPALGAIEAANEVGGYTVGYVGDMTSDGPNTVLLNLYWDLEPMFDEMLKETRDGTFNGPYYWFGVKEGSLTLTYNTALKDKIPPEAVEKANQALADIQSGKFEVPYVPQ